MYHTQEPTSCHKQAQINRWSMLILKCVIRTLGCITQFLDSRKFSSRDLFYNKQFMNIYCYVPVLILKRTQLRSLKWVGFVWVFLFMGHIDWCLVLTPGSKLRDPSWQASGDCIGWQSNLDWLFKVSALTAVQLPQPKN